ncbi:hypothetical protein [Clostridium sp. Marseille-P299]|nr:hypothetical protein [Clostridium sp. Marseille-P299]
MSDDNNVDLGDILINDGKVINIASTIDSYEFSDTKIFIMRAAITSVRV